MGWWKTEKANPTTKKPGGPVTKKATMCEADLWDDLICMLPLGHDGDHSPFPPPRPQKAA
jgi:hypothetical protein